RAADLRQDSIRRHGPGRHCELVGLGLGHGPSTGRRLTAVELATHYSQIRMRNMINHLNGVPGGPMTTTYRYVSADQHLDLLWTPPDLWERLLPARFRDRAPEVVDTEEGRRWTWEGKVWGPSASGVEDLDIS